VRWAVEDFLPGVVLLFFEKNKIPAMSKTNHKYLIFKEKESGNGQ
jgi:hypothetical protein